MVQRFIASVSLLLAAVLSFAAADSAVAQIAFGVNSAGNLFRFDVNNPANVTTIGAVGFVPEGIDFRPGTSTLYGIDVGAATTQLFTIDINTGAAAPVGGGFPSMGTVNGTAYTLVGSTSYGFDFNPTTLQADNSMRIRLVGTSGVNLRLHSATGQVAVVDGPLLFAGTGNSGFVDASAYINNMPTMGGTTQLFNLDSRNDELLLQNPPNAGTLNTVGPLGATIDAEANISFDVFTAQNSTDSTIGGDSGFAVLRRLTTASGAYLLYDVNLATGQITGGALVGPAATPFDFTGGFAVLPVPEPSSIVLLGLAAASIGCVLRRRRR